MMASAAPAPVLPKTVKPLKNRKKNVSLKCKEISSNYNEETQSKEFKKVFEELVDQM